MTVEYDTTSKKLTIIYGSDKTIELQVIDTFYLKIKGMENTPIFPLNETRLYEVEQQDVTGAVIKAPQGWNVVLKDNELSAIRNKEIGFIFQGFNLIANLNAVENVELPLIYRGIGKQERRKLAKEALEMVGLGHRMDHKPSEMSGGQQQRVAIARAIAAKPPVILADEPTGNLDSASSKEILQILKDLHSGGRTVILITHDDGIAEQAYRIIRILDGKIESDRKNDKILESREEIK